jgi:sulfate adenylyltransferase (ADP) / ATP adenylyltransferase
MSAISSQPGQPARLEPGTLCARAVRATQHALACGAQQPIPTTWELVEQSGVRFVIRMASHLVRKKRPPGASAAPARNPFLPYDPDLHVTDISDTHICLLNKYNITDHHLLIVTRHFEDQESLLTIADFQAMWACLAEFEGLAFYNGGAVAGASQPHKHLQIVPLPLVPQPGISQSRIPIEPLLAGAHDDHTGQRVHGVPLAVAPALRFAHSLVRIPRAWTGTGTGTGAAARPTFACYQAMLHSLGLLGQDPSRPAPYNLLVTREWMLAVPRSTEHVGSISVNALGFAGSFFVRDPGELALVKELGPMTILERVAVTAMCSA